MITLTLLTSEDKAYLIKDNRRDKYFFDSSNLMRNFEKIIDRNITVEQAKKKILEIENIQLKHLIIKQ